MKLLLGYPPTPSFKFTERTFYIFRNERTNGFTPPPPPTFSGLGTPLLVISYVCICILCIPAWRPATLLKQKFRHMFFCDFCKIFKNTYFVENLRTAAFEKKQQMNYRLNIKNGVTENLLNYLPEKCNKKKQ